MLRRFVDSAWGGFVIAAISIGTVMTPTVLGDEVFGVDYINHLWLVGYQGQAIRTTGFPTLFIHTKDVFEPVFAFYGGTLYAVAGYLTAALGSRPQLAFALMILAGLTMAYGGTWWLGRLLGLTGWVAHAPAVVVVTAPYLLADLYARGAWPEFMAMCSIPMVVAGIVALLSADRWRPAPFLGLLVGTVAFTGTHNAILLWGCLVFGLVGVAIFVVMRDRVRLRRVLAVGALMGLAVGVNAWFLLLDLRFASTTIAGHLRFFPNSAPMFNTFGALLDPLRGTPKGSGTPGLTVAVPVLALAWALVAVAVCWRRTSAPNRRLWAILLGAVVVVGGVIMWPAFWRGVGRPLDEIQFPYRLNGFLLLLVAGLVLLSLRMPVHRLGLSALGLVLVASIGMAGWQVWHVGNRPGSVPITRDQTFQRGLETKPVTWYDNAVYADHSRPIVRPAPTRVASIAASKPGTERQTARVEIPAGSGPVALNLEGGPDLVAIRGATVIGRTAGGRAVLSEPASVRPRVITLHLTKADNAVTWLAPAITLIAASVAVVWWLVLLLPPVLAARFTDQTAREPRSDQG